ncbi:MAG: cache domain-containing protein, partial [Pseudomonadota bacterium]
MFSLSELKIGRFRFKIPLLIPLVFSISLMLTILVIRSDNECALEHEKTKELHVISEQIENDFCKTAGKAESRADMIATIPSIGKAFKDEDRNGLIHLLLPMFREQKKNFGVTGVQFNKIPAATFLRLHKPESYGDDLSDYRETVVSVHKFKSKQKGLELGRSGLAIRGVVPVFYEKEHIGSLEFLFSFSSILEKIKKTTDADISIFINKKKYDEICTDVSNEKEKKEKKLTDEQLEVINTIGKFRYLDSTNKEKIMSLMTSTYLSKSTEFYTVFPIVDGKEEGVALEPLFDFSGAKIGVIVISKNFDKINAQYQDKFAKNIIIKLIQLLLVLMISIFVYNAWLM